MVNKSGQQLYKQQTKFHGWDAYEIGNGLIRLVAVPDLGGRLMAYDLGEYDFLFVDRDLSGKLFSPEENQGEELRRGKNLAGTTGLGKQ
jgi:hypothetical protein